MPSVGKSTISSQQKHPQLRRSSRLEAMKRLSDEASGERGPEGGRRGRGEDDGDKRIIKVHFNYKVGFN